MQEYELVIKNGTVVTTKSTYLADIGIIDERIAAIGEELSGKQEIEATGKFVVPGAVDVHVHMQMPLRANVISADDFFTGTRAAALGGTTTIIDFVAAGPAQSLSDALTARQTEADSKVVIDYGLHMTITPTDIKKLAEVSEIVDAGCPSFKLYMAYGFRLDDGELLQALEAVAAVEGLPVVHAENWDIISTLVDRHLAAGQTEAVWHPRSRPALLEGEAVGRVIDIAAFVGTPLYIFHVSCAKAVERIGAAQKRGLPIYAETCPQYLFLTETLYDQPGPAGTLPVCAPPLRTEADQARLWTALIHDELQVISTDHCPFSRADKMLGLENFSLIPGGVPSIEARYSLIYHYGVRTGRFDLNRWVDLCATTPARLFGLTRKGSITPGYDADLVIFDPDKQVRLATDTLHEQVDWTPYEGLEVTGWPSVTISRGEIIAEDGNFLGEAGRGRFVRRTL
jgi:dihydropyrimidinase